ncbi:hypothetical protein PLESTB_001200900 [Pleodorina starrii]|uniref:RRM domain-containing protein n=1 Tax=Pleodorina starrii TaxID=330485 RepID=A0A9W6F5H6_9CHLO|nr:hypothetical protein PLESTM_001805900 [Pleodorina starrii]GLC57222.1 hypothetical protein PLESTB_001200900 [Pleodorina starrii]GLC71389.1 hypothetical protein PLESTF_001110200 [Pleodorina starrii]
MDRSPTATVFIGNIPYDVTEQMLMETFAQAGPIKSLRLLSDKDTGKPKGYGFCEFHDVQTAQSAVRNLNKYEVNGRMLRVDFADEHAPDARGKRDKEPRGPEGRRGGPVEQSLAPGPPPGTRPIGREAAGAAATQMNALLGNAPYTGPSQEKISTVIAGMTPMQLFEILSQMRTLCQQNHAAARSILVANPQLTKALFQAQVLLGMVKGSAPPPSSIVAALAPPPMQGPPPPQQPQPPQPVGPPGQAPGGPMGPPPPHAMVPPPGAPQMQPPPQALPPQYGVATGPGGPFVAAAVPQPGQQAVTVVSGLPPGPMLIDPATGLPYTAPPGAVIVPTGQPQPQQPIMQAAPPPPPQAPPQPVPEAPPAPAPAPVPAPAAPAGAPGGPPATVQLPANLGPQQAQVLQQVLSLTPAQIDALPPAQRQQVLLVRQQLGLGAPGAQQ